MNEKIKTVIRKHLSGIALVPLMKTILPYNWIRFQNGKKLAKSPDPKPCLFNAAGEELLMFYISTNADSYCLTAGRIPQHIFWNHWDISLPIHFYGYLEIKEAKSDLHAVKKCFYLQESKAIIPTVYTYVMKHEKDMMQFDYIFTSDKEILDKYKNARFCPAGGVWYGTPRWGGVPTLENFKLKNRNISLLASHKVRCDLHRFRYHLATKYKESDLVDVFATFDGGPMVPLADALDHYRYSIVIENNQLDYYFTEKILNCFASLTVPIYIGATQIGDFFNIDGIIQISEPTTEAIEQAIQLCGEKDYQARQAAIVDNFERVKGYWTPEDYIYAHYKNELGI